MSSVAESANRSVHVRLTLFCQHEVSVVPGCRRFRHHRAVYVTLDIQGPLIIVTESLNKYLIGLKIRGYKQRWTVTMHLVSATVQLASLAVRSLASGLLFIWRKLSYVWLLKPQTGLSPSSRCCFYQHTTSEESCTISETDTRYALTSTGMSRLNSEMSDGFLLCFRLPDRGVS